MQLPIQSRARTVSLVGEKDLNDLEPFRANIRSGSSTLAAFDYLMAYAGAAGFKRIIRASGAVPAVELRHADRQSNPFAVQTRPDHLNFYLRRPALRHHDELFDAATQRFGPVKPNRLGEYRLRLRTCDDVDEMLGFLRLQGVWPTHRRASRFTAPTLEVVSGEHLLNAARSLADGKIADPFGISTDYDVVFEGIRLPPKAVFGLAATEALGFDVRPENFRGGEGTQCFRILRANGYQIAAKDAEQEGGKLNDDDRIWTEGRPRLVTHLTRERGSGLAAAKRDSFRLRHGRLFCERCGMDPVASFRSAEGEACIEVHHRETAVRDMATAHRTRLEDLECLCANCHRVVHRILKSVLITEA